MLLQIEIWGEGKSIKVKPDPEISKIDPKNADFEIRSILNLYIDLTT